MNLNPKFPLNISALKSRLFFLMLVICTALFKTDSKLRLDFVFPHGVKSNHTHCTPRDRTGSLVIKNCFLPVPLQFPPSQFSLLSLSFYLTYTHAHAHTNWVTSDGYSWIPPLMRMSSSRHMHERWRRVWKDYVWTVNVTLIRASLISIILNAKSC